MFAKMASKLTINSSEKQDEVNSKSTDFLFGRWLSRPPAGEEVVISGMSGRFPESNNIYELRDNLFNKKDMVTDDGRRWQLDHPEIPKRTAKIYNIDKFDPGFFGLHYRQANMMDPMMRGILQAAQEAIMDAGVNPSELEGSKTGVFISTSWSDMANENLIGITKPQKFGVTGYLKSMIARRISYHLKLKGPSFIIDTACSSSSYALDEAFKSIRTGKCDNALVGTTNLLLHPGSTIQFFRLGVLSRGGKCKVFDEDADGYARGETIACIFLQKAKNSRRIYGQVINTKANCDGYKEHGITFPSTKLQKQLMTEIYDESGIDPCDLSYLEAHGTGTQVGDPEEVEAIDCAVAKRRQTPLWIGSVKSSIGHTEPASGIGSLVKVIIAMETGRIPPNINLNQIKKGMKGLEQGRLKVVTETTDLEGNEAIVGINNFGFGGGNCHVVIRRFNKKKAMTEEGNIPVLICVSGRTEDSVLTIFNDLNKRQVNPEYNGLFHQIFKKDIANHLYRGYTIISSNGTIKTSSQRITEQRPPLYIIFGKFENCFRFLGRDFLDFPVFKATMSRINNILSNENINITDVLQDETKLGNDFVAMVAVQVGIVDTLKSLELEASAAYGDSFEKLICAYFNETNTLEETILTALKIGKNTFETNPQMDFEKVFSELTQASTENHNRYFFKASGKLRGSKNVHKEPSSYETFNNMSKNSIVLNFSDKHLNRINMVFPGSYTVTFLEAMGSLYEQGYNPQLDKLYPEINYPVRRGTPMISPLVRWNHQKSWQLYKFSEFVSSDCEQKEYNLAFLYDEYKHIGGHVIDGRNLLPATEYLNLVWQTFAQSRRLLPTDLPVVFKNCKFIRAVTMPKTGFLKLLVSIQKGTGTFEVLEKNSLVVSGRIYSPTEIKDHQTDLPPFVLNEKDPTNILEQDEIYKELYLRGYNYSGLFKGVVKCNVESSTALVKWENNWTAFMDKMLQMEILHIDTRFLYVPTGIKKLTIDPFKHARVLASSKEEECLLPVHVYKENNIIKSGGIEISGIQASTISRKKPPIEPVLEQYEFVPNNASLSLTQSARVNTQIILENSLENNFKAVEIIDEFTNSGREILLSLINKALNDVPMVNPDLTVSTKMVLEEIPGVKMEEFVLSPTSNLLLIVGTEILQRTTVLKQCLTALNINGFVLTREAKDFVPGVIEGIEILTEHIIENEKLILCKRSEQIKSTHYIEVSSQHFKWLPELRTALKREQNVLVYSQNQEYDGIMGFLNCIRREPGGHKVRGFLMIDEAIKFDPRETFYKDQIKKSFSVNIYKQSKWGTYRHFVLDDIPKVESKHCYANVTVNGNLSSLNWIEGPLTPQTPLKEDKLLIHTYYAAVNFKDIMLASGRINADVITSDRIEQECLLGFEFSGRDRSGNRVAGMTSNRALSTFAVADVNFIWPVPATWNLEDAATVPVVYSTVVYALLMVTNLKPGVSILIHSATGGIGIAALNVALYHGCDVFATVGTQEKRDFLKEQYPQIPDNHIGNSRDTSFEEMIKSERKGRGVDIVLNSLTGDKLRASINCLARGGKFMEIGKFDLANDTSLKLMSMENEITYYGVMLDQIFEKSPQVKRRLSKMVSDGMRLGFIKPLPRTVFCPNEVETAFRYMTTGKHIGKVLVKIRDEEGQKVVVPTKILLNCIPRFHCDSKKSYIIIGGLGGIGLELADWLVLRGAKKLILISTSGIKTGYPTQRIRNWKKYGVTVHISKIDITTKLGCLELIKESNRFGTVDGIFNLAVVLRDALFEDQTEENFRISFAPKAHITTVLDQVTREHCPDLRYFVIFSSVSCGRGNAGQTNYGMANSIMERICEKRKQDGYPALAIQWGAIGDVGLVAKMQKENRELVIGGTLQQKISSCLEVLDKFLKQDNPIVSSMVVAEKLNKSFGLLSAVDAVAQVLGIKDIKFVSPHSTLAELGMDSMMGTEVMQILEKDFEIYITPKDIRNLTFAKLIEIEAEKKSNVEEKSVSKTEQVTNMVLQYIPDRKTSDLPIIKLPSLVDDDEEAAIVYVLPGLEGVFFPFEPLTKNLKAHVLGLQYNYDNPEDTIQEVAETILPYIEENISKQQTFYIIGYSYGVLIALEIAALLEAKSFTGNIIAIDGAPAYLSATIKKRFPWENQAELETLLMCQIAALLLPFDVIAKNTDNILKCTTFDDRINTVMSLIPANVPNREDLDKQAAHVIYKRFRAVYKYDFTHNKIKSSLHLFKAKYPLMANTEADYKLSELCEQPVQVTVLDADHVTILKHTELAEAVSKLTQST